MWDGRGGTGTAVLRVQGDAVHSAVFSPDGTRILTAGENGLPASEMASAAPRLPHSRRTRPPSQPRQFIQPGQDADPDHFRGQDRAAVEQAAARWATSRNRTSNINSAVFSPDGARILTAGEDRTARLSGRLAHGTGLAVLGGHEGRVWGRIPARKRHKDPDRCEHRQEARVVMREGAFRPGQRWQEGRHVLQEGTNDPINRAEFSRTAHAS